MPRTIPATNKTVKTKSGQMTMKIPAVKKKWVESETVKQYRIDRDRIIWKLHPESRKEIEEYYAQI